MFFSKHIQAHVLLDYTYPNPVYLTVKCVNLGPYGMGGGWLACMLPYDFRIICWPSQERCAGYLALRWLSNCWLYSLVFIRIKRERNHNYPSKIQSSSPSKQVLVEDLYMELGPALKSPGSVVDVNGVAPESCIACLWVVHLGLTLPETLKNLPSTPWVDGPLAEKTLVREKFRTANELTNQMHLCHSGNSYFTESLKAIV